MLHVDASKKSVAQARDNAALSGIADAPIRYIADDCLKFVAREARRERRYDAIIMDPPSYGRGSGGEVWKLEEHLWKLLAECRGILSEQPLFFLMNGYASSLSPVVLGNLLGELMAGKKGAIAVGELGIPESRHGRVLPYGIYGRW